MNVDALRIRPGKRVRLSDHDSRATPGFDGDGENAKARADALREANVQSLAELHDTLWAENKRSLLVVMQGMDTSGKDGVIRSVFTGLNPQGCHVTSFKKPSEDEADRDYLERIHRAVPRKGEIGVFNRAHYEDVLIVRVHAMVAPAVWKRRYDEINAFEKYLVTNGVSIVKLFLHISKDEQKKRLESRLKDPTKRWKFSPQDVEERKLWPAYMRAYEDALSRCSTPHAPWFVIPSDRKWYRNWAASEIVLDAMRRMSPRLPRPAHDVSRIRIV